MVEGVAVSVTSGAPSMVTVAVAVACCPLPLTVMVYVVVVVGKTVADPVTTVAPKFEDTTPVA